MYDTSNKIIKIGGSTSHPRLESAFLMKVDRIFSFIMSFCVIPSFKDLFSMPNNQYSKYGKKGKKEKNNKIF